MFKVGSATSSKADNLYYQLYGLHQPAFPQRLNPTSCFPFHHLVLPNHQPPRHLIILLLFFSPTRLDQFLLSLYLVTQCLVRPKEDGQQAVFSSRELGLVIQTRGCTAGSGMCLLSTLKVSSPQLSSRSFSHPNRSEWVSFIQNWILHIFFFRGGCKKALLVGFRRKCQGILR